MSYEPRTFQAGDIITATELNEMNTQIKQNNLTGKVCVRYDAGNQNLVPAQQYFARHNIDAAQAGMIISLFYNDETNQFTTNKTFKEIKQAYELDSTRIIILSPDYVNNNKTIVPYYLCDLEEDYISFAMQYGPLVDEIIIHSDNTVTQNYLLPEIKINNHVWNFVDDAADTMDLTEAIEEIVNAKIQTALAQLNN